MNRATRQTDRRQALQLDASASVDLDEIDELSFDYTWHCENGSGGDCVSQAGDTVDMSSSSNGAELTIAAGSLPIGKRSTYLLKSCRHCVPSVFSLEHRFLRRKLTQKIGDLDCI